MSFVSGYRVAGWFLYPFWLLRGLSLRVGHLVGLDRRTPVKYRVAVCAMFKNEAGNLDEWLSFHQLSGVEHFFLYDDSSEDDFHAVLDPWIDSGMVTLRSTEGRRQTAVFNHCLRHGGTEARWLAFIDIDEFLFSPHGHTLAEVFERYSPHPAVFAHWVLFGSNGHTAPPPGGVLESYTRSLSVESAINDRFDHRRSGHPADYVTGWARDGKSIVNPRAIARFGIHLPTVVGWGRTVDEQGRPARRRTPSGTGFSCDIIRINHYWSKTLSELRDKAARGRASMPGRDQAHIDRAQERESHLNETTDTLILEVLEKLTVAAPSRGRPVLR